MTESEQFRIRPGRIRSAKAPNARSFLAQALKAAEKAGGIRRSGRTGAGGFGRGRTASLIAQRMLGDRSRGAMVKARVVRRMRSPGALRAHIGYLQRDGVTRDGSPGRLFSAESDEADGDTFAQRCEDDRHHFRFIVSPDDAVELADLREFTRELMTQASADLGSKLDWVAVDHWNTEHPHIHVLVRGRADDGEDLVISRDYISQGLRARAGALVALELGPRTELEVRRGWEAEIAAERWTRLDRLLAREAVRTDGLVDLRPERDVRPDAMHELRIGRMRTLERLGIAEPAGPARWSLAADAEPRLRALGERNDIIKRMHRELTARRVGREPGAWVLEGDRHAEPVVGRLIAKGLDDELKGTAYAIVDGVDGRVHHLRLPDLDSAGDGSTGSIVELRRYEDANGHRRAALAVRSDLAIGEQVEAPGATWLDRRLLAREAVQLGQGGFGAEVRQALDDRTTHLVAEGLARREGDRILFRRNLLDDLRRRELGRVAARLATETGLPYRASDAGDEVDGTYRRRLTLASGRFAMIDNGLGFQLVPWSPSLERELGRHVEGIAGPGSVDWSFGRKRGLSI